MCLPPHLHMRGDTGRGKVQCFAVCRMVRGDSTAFVLMAGLSQTAASKLTSVKKDTTARMEPPVW